jgi:hypothetical protein
MKQFGTVSSSAIFVLIAVGQASGGSLELISNGGFEAGLTGWTSTQTVNTPIGSCATPWVAGTSGSATQCVAVDSPIYGLESAYTSFDGYGAGTATYGAGYTTPQDYLLSEQLTIPNVVVQGQLSWADTYEVYPSTTYSPSPYPTVLPRTFSIDLTTVGGAELANLYTQQFNPTFSGGPLTHWTTNSVDATTILQAYAGQTVWIQYDPQIPKYFTGVAGFGLDNASLAVTTTPEPGTQVLIATALIAAFGWTLVSNPRRNLHDPRKVLLVLRKLAESRAGEARGRSTV